MSQLKRIICVLAMWCPHCEPITIKIIEKMKKELKVEIRILDIEKSEEEKEADEIVKNYGEWDPDYVIPQVFFEYDDKIKHIWAGSSEPTNRSNKNMCALPSATKLAWENFLKNDFYKSHLEKAKNNP